MNHFIKNKTQLKKILDNTKDLETPKLKTNVSLKVTTNKETKNKALTILTINKYFLINFWRDNNEKCFLSKKYIYGLIRKILKFDSFLFSHFFSIPKFHFQCFVFGLNGTHILLFLCILFIFSEWQKPRKSLR